MELDPCRTGGSRPARHAIECPLLCFHKVTFLQTVNFIQYTEVLMLLKPARWVRSQSPTLSPAPHWVGSRALSPEGWGVHSHDRLVLGPRCRFPVHRTPRRQLSDPRMCPTRSRIWAPRVSRSTVSSGLGKTGTSSFHCFHRLSGPYLKIEMLKKQLPFLSLAGSPSGPERPRVRSRSYHLK